MNTKIESLSELLLDALNLNFTSFEWLKTFKPFPTSDVDLYKFLDRLLTDSKHEMDFHLVYENMLAKMPENFIGKIAKSNFENLDFWLISDNDKVPKYSPSISDLNKAQKQSPSRKIVFENLRHSQIIDFFGNNSASFLNSILREGNRLTSLEFSFESLVNVPIRFGAWYSSAVFLQFYQQNKKHIFDQKSDEIFGHIASLYKLKNSLLLSKNIAIKFNLIGSIELPLPAKNYFYLDESRFEFLIEKNNQNDWTISCFSTKDKPILLAISITDFDNFLI